MQTVSQLKNLGDVLKYEAPSLYSRDLATVGAGQNLQLGSVVGRVTSTGKLKALNPSATDGSEIAVGVLGNDVDATLIDRDDAILIARHAIVARDALRWPSDITAAQKAAAIALLEARGILVRDGA